MAARENQGYLIAVICLVLLTLILALVAFLGISKANEYADVRDGVNRDLALEKNISSAYLIQIENLKAYIGGQGVSVSEVGVNLDSMNRLVNSDFDDSQKNTINAIIANAKEVHAAYENDMKQFITNDDEEGEAQEPTYQNLTQNLAAVLNKKHFDSNVLRKDINRIQQESAAEIAARDKIVSEARASLEVARTELRTEKERATKKETAMQVEMDKMQTQIDQTIAFAKTKEKKANAYSEGLEANISGLKKENVSLKTRVDHYEREVFDLPDGRIVRVSPSIKAVHVNLGSADGLRPNRTFAVYDESESNFVDGEHKATIEVTDITGAHQAVARITYENPRNPILKGDKVLTATWDPGYRVPIALVGTFDLDRDGRSDLDRLVTMIEKNGGRVVAKHDESGKITGKVDSSTRYLVLGSEPKLGADDDTQVLDAIATLMKQGSDNSVQEIDLRKLLNWMGLHGKGPASVQRLDSRMGDEFRRRDPRSQLKSRARK